jgi:hypothetical protein
VSPLCVVIERILDGQALIAQRLANIEMKTSLGADINPIDAHSSCTERSGASLPFPHGFIFEEELNNSWVYRRVGRSPNIGNFSIVSSAGRTASWSMLSGLSLSDLSNISVLALPIYATDLNNSEVYQFGESDLTIPEKISSRMAIDGLDNKRQVRRPLGWGKLLREMAGIRPAPQSSPSKAPEEGENISTGPIFGVPLQASLEVSSVPIALAKADNSGRIARVDIAGYLPTVIAR